MLNKIYIHYITTLFVLESFIISCWLLKGKKIGIGIGIGQFARKKSVSESATKNHDRCITNRDTVFSHIAQPYMIILYIIFYILNWFKLKVKLLFYQTTQIYLTLVDQLLKTTYRISLSLLWVSLLHTRKTWHLVLDICETGLSYVISMRVVYSEKPLMLLETHLGHLGKIWKRNRGFTAQPTKNTYTQSIRLKGLTGHRWVHLVLYCGYCCAAKHCITVHQPLCELRLRFCSDKKLVSTCPPDTHRSGKFTSIKTGILSDMLMWERFREVQNHNGNIYLRNSFIIQQDLYTGNIRLS